MSNVGLLPRRCDKLKWTSPTYPTLHFSPSGRLSDGRPTEVVTDRPGHPDNGQCCLLRNGRGSLPSVLLSCVSDSDQGASEESVCLGMPYSVMSLVSEPRQVNKPHFLGFCRQPLKLTPSRLCLCSVSLTIENNCVSPLEPKSRTIRRYKRERH